MKFQRRVYGGGRVGFNTSGWQPMAWQGREEQLKDYETIQGKPLFPERHNAAGVFLRGEMDQAAALKILDGLNPELFPTSFSLFQTQSSPQESVEAAKEFIAHGTMPAKISADTPVEQFAWGVALAATSHETPDLQQHPIWKVVENAAALNHERNTLRSIAMSNVRNSKLSVRWGVPAGGYPDIGFYYDHVNNVVNADMVWSLIMGLEHARAPMMHEIGHGELSVSFSPKMDALFKRIDALTEKQQSGTQLSEDEYKELIESRIEWDLRNRVYQEAENSTVNHFATGNGRQYGQDIGYSLNAVQMVPPSPADLMGSDISEWEKAFLNVTQAVRLLFFQNNGLFADDPADWEKFDVDVKAIDHIVGAEGAAIGYNDLRQRIIGPNGMQYRQPGQFDRLMGAATFAAKAETNSHERGQLVDDLFDTYCSGFLADAKASMAQQMSQQQEFEQFQQMLDEMLKQAMQERQEARRQQQQKQANAQKGSGDGKQDAKGNKSDQKGDQAGKEGANDGQQPQEGKPGQEGGQGKPDPSQAQGGQPGGSGGQNQPAQPQQASNGGQGTTSGQGQSQGGGQDAPPTPGDLTRQIMREIFKDFAEKIALETGEAPKVGKPPQGPQGEYKPGQNVGHNQVPDMLDVMPDMLHESDDADNTDGGGNSYGRSFNPNSKGFDVSGGELNDYQKIISPHKATINEVKRLLADLEKRRYQHTKQAAETFELLPEGGEMSRFDGDRQQDLMRKIALQQGFDINDLERFNEDNPNKKIIVPNSYVILIDTSGSMDGEPFDHAVAAAAVLFEATRGNRNAQTYIVAMGAPTPTVITTPKDKPLEVARRIAAIREHVGGDKDYFKPSLVKALQEFSAYNKQNSAVTGMIHVFPCTDGFYTDIEKAIPFMKEVVEQCGNITIDHCMITERTNQVDALTRSLKGNAQKRFGICHCTSEGQVRSSLIDLVRGRLKMPIEEAIKMGDQRKQLRTVGLELRV